MEGLFNNITDIFGNSVVDDTSPYVLVHSNELYKLLIQLYKEKTYSLWDYNHSLLKQLFTEKNLTYKNYVPLGHIYLNNDDFKMNNILFANRLYLPTTQKFKYVANLSHGSLWVAISDDDNYDALGLVYSKDISPPNTEMGLIPKNMTYVDKNNLNYSSPFKGMFNLINHSNIGRSKLLTNKLYRSSKLFRMFNRNGKFLTDVNGSVKLKDRVDQKNQGVSYNAQGELIIGGKCLKGKNYEISLETCNGGREQRWLRKDNEYSTLDDDLCLTSDGENVSLKPCDSTASFDTVDDDKTWYTENQESDDLDMYTTRGIVPNKYKGKNVVLVEAENPWYTDKDMSMIQNVINTDDGQYNNLDYGFADFKSNFNIDARRKDLGYGNSYASRQGDKCIEGFDDSENKNVIFILCILLAFLILYKIKW